MPLLGRGRMVIRGIAVALSLCVVACGGDDEAPPTSPPPAPVAVLGAFPAELAALLDRATVEETIEIDGHSFRSGTLGGVPVVMAMTGIGLVNATMTTRMLLANFEVSGIVVSGVAGSPLRIGDVAVPETWTLADGIPIPVSPDWLALAEQLAAANIILTQCTEVPTAETNPVCLPFAPVVVVGGIGRSTDSFGERPFPCQPTNDRVFGCDVAGAAAGVPVKDHGAMRGLGDEGEVAPAAEDMETAAVAREARAAGVRFISFRATSDGREDPLMLPGFPAQFFAYYPLASDNAAAATTAFLQELAVTR